MRNYMNNQVVRTYYDVIKDKELYYSFDKLWLCICTPYIMYKKKSWIENALRCQKYNREAILEMNKMLVDRYLPYNTEYTERCKNCKLKCSCKKMVANNR